jgi:Mlc titration factor MtfA (ptsG expression regulator)
MLKQLKRWLGLTDHGTSPVPPALWALVEARLPFLAYLPDAARPRLRTLTEAFLAEKEFYGANDLPITDEIMLTIAVQACLPVLNINAGLAAYRDWIGIVVYPGDFIIPRREMDEAGVVHEYEMPVLGEARGDGPVLVAWFDASTATPGVNAVIHEFVHKLDMANGDADGFPALPASMSRQRWAEAFTAAYQRLCWQVDAGFEPAIDPYAADSPAEFFAVASEAFFETPLRLQAAFPAVYAQLSTFYGLDTASGEARLPGMQAF